MLGHTPFGVCLIGSLFTYLFSLRYEKIGTYAIRRLSYWKFIYVSFLTSLRKDWDIRHSAFVLLEVYLLAFSHFVTKMLGHLGLEPRTKGL